MMHTSFIWSKTRLLSWVMLALILALLPASTISPVLAQTSRPLMFVKNVGQFPDTVEGEEIHFQLSGKEATFSFADQALWLTLAEPAESADSLQAASPRRGISLKLSFLKANPQAHLESFNRLDTRISYFGGSDPALWHSDVPVWGGVRYVDLYPGVDLEFTGKNKQLVSRLIVKDNAAAMDSIRWQVAGADALGLDNNRLRMSTVIGDFLLTLFSLEHASSFT